jgi:hypothetical protein
MRAAGIQNCWLYNHDAAVIAEPISRFLRLVGPNQAAAEISAPSTAFEQCCDNHTRFSERFGLWGLHRMREVVRGVLALKSPAALRSNLNLRSFSNVIGYVLNERIAKLDTVSNLELRSVVRGDSNALKVRNTVAQNHDLIVGRRWNQRICRDQDLRSLADKVKTYRGVHSRQKLTFSIRQLDLGPHSTGGDVD